MPELLYGNQEITKRTGTAMIIVPAFRDIHRAREYNAKKWEAFQFDDDDDFGILIYYDKEYRRWIDTDYSEPYTSTTTTRIEMTRKEAIELRNKLNDLLGEQEQTIIPLTPFKVGLPI